MLIGNNCDPEICPLIEVSIKEGYPLSGVPQCNIVRQNDYGTVELQQLE